MNSMDFNKLSDELRPVIKHMASYVASMGLDREEAEQELLLSVWKSLQKYDKSKGSCPKTYAYWHLRGKASDLRKTEPERVSYNDDAGRGDYRFTPELLTSSYLMDAEVTRILARGSRWASGIYKAVKAGYSLTEIARHIGYTLGRVSQIWHREIIPAVRAVTA